MFCCSTKLQCPKEKKPISSLPPPCCHRKEILFYCPVNVCVSPEPRLRNPRHCPSSFPSLTCKPKPECSPLPPTICVAGPCSQPSASESYCRPSAPKILPPPSRVQFCIRYTNEGSSSYPCSNLPKCPGEIC
ncbi:hypothetical protein PUN28_017132 [Cardiocondyla obscurior]|uniref:Uncharacterized protein n=1 Tax=Cardiocondyla obscurior TaxID=286306 RepID=A0AAW2EN48_9HYME